MRVLPSALRVAALDASPTAVRTWSYLPRPRPGDRAPSEQSRAEADVRPDRPPSRGVWERAEDYADAVDEHMRGLVLVMAGVEAVMGIASAVRLAYPASLVMGIVQATAVAGLLVFWRVLRGRRLPHRTSQPVIAGLISIFALMLPLEMALTGNALLTANLGLLVVATGALVVQTRWFAAATTVVVLVWLLVLVTRGPWDLPVDRLVVFVAVAVLVAALVHVLRVRGRDQLVAALAAARAIALRDELTGLWNRRGGRAAVAQVLAHARLSGEPVWVVSLDVAGLKRVNDRCGHPAGDQVLVSVGKAMLQRLARGEVPMRWGGDEFLLIGDGPLPDVDQLVHELMAAAGAFGGRVGQPWRLDPGAAQARGIDDDAALDRLLAAADADLYDRRGGTNSRSERG
jgi:diguanylate cyclase (GGDEF)-like protein